MTLNNDEKKILNLIKIGPLLIVLFSIVIIYIMIHNNRKSFENEIVNIKKESLIQKKELIKNEIDKVLSLIEYEKQHTKNELEYDIKQRVDIAHTIATSIYNENRDKSDIEVKKMINDALRNVRFYDDRGYFFIFGMDGTSILHPIFSGFEEKILINNTNNQGNKILKKMVNLIEAKKEGFLTWWWSKPEDKKIEYEKLGFIKYFEPLDIFIGTGEYIIDYETKLQKDLLKKIQKIRYGENGYIFIGNEDGINLSHINKNIIGTSILHFKDANGVMLVQEIIKLAKIGGGYLSYEIDMPSTGKKAKKISYVKGLSEWKWAIGTGTYINEVEQLIANKKIQLEEKNKKEIKEIVFISLIIFIMNLLILLYFSKKIKNTFAEYKVKVEEKTLDLKNLNNELEQKVKDRTTEIEKQHKVIMAQSKLAAVGEMLSNIAHQWRQPLAVISVHMMNMRLKIELDKKLSNEEIEEISDKVEDQCQYLSKTIDDFRNYFVDDSSMLCEFDVKDELYKTKELIKDSFSSNYIEIVFDLVSCVLYANKNTFIQGMITLFTNAKDAMISNEIATKDRYLFVAMKKNADEVIISFRDSGGGIKENVIDKIFEPYFTTKHQSQGTGLGLYITHQIITKQLKGCISAKNCEYTYNGKKHKGADFIIRIPN